MQIAQRFSTEEAAREYFEKLRWPDGPVCPHCGNADQERVYESDAKSPEENPRGALQVRRMPAKLYRYGRDGLRGFAYYY